MQAKLQVEFMGTANWFPGTKFEWTMDSVGHTTSYHMSQESYVNDVVDRMGLMLASGSPLMTPY